MAENDQEVKEMEEAPDWGGEIVIEESEGTGSENET